MPQRFMLRELEVGHIGGVPFVVAHARGGQAIGFVATADGDGLMESAEDCRQFAQRLRERIDKIGEEDQTKG